MSASAAPKLAKGVWPPASKAPAKAAPAKTTAGPAAKAAAAKAPATESPAKRATKSSGARKKATRTVKKGEPHETPGCCQEPMPRPTVPPEPATRMGLARVSTTSSVRETRVRVGDPARSDSTTSG